MVSSGTPHLKPTQQQGAHLLALTAICTEIRRESIGMFYAKNVFQLVIAHTSSATEDAHVNLSPAMRETSLNGCWKWLGSMGSANLAYLRKLDLDVGRWRMYTASNQAQKIWHCVRDLARYLTTYNSDLELSVFIEMQWWSIRNSPPDGMSFHITLPLRRQPNLDAVLDEAEVSLAVRIVGQPTEDERSLQDLLRLVRFTQLRTDGQQDELAARWFQ